MIVNIIKYNMIPVQEHDNITNIGNNNIYLINKCKTLDDKKNVSIIV